jgi:tRNA threonylcarbamoyl adenosine modification protein YeaZ
LPPEPYVLAFDTSAAHCAAALLSGDRLVDLRHEDMATGQADRLIPLLEEMLAGAGIGWHDLVALGVGTGPGNFTGVRIAVAAARGLALGLGIPAIGITTFDALALGAQHPAVVRLDARRGQVYQQVFADAPTPARLLEPGEETPLPQGAAFLGHEAESMAAHHTGRPATPVFPLAEAIARLAAAGRDRPQMRPAPFYLRGADALPSSDPPPVILA